MELRKDLVETTKKLKKDHPANLPVAVILELEGSYMQSLILQPMTVLFRKEKANY